MLLLGHVLDEQAPRHRPALDHRLIHGEDVGAPLRLVGHQRAGRVQHARRHQPAGARLQAIRLAVVEDAVVALVPVVEAAARCRPWSCPAPGRRRCRGSCCRGRSAGVENNTTPVYPAARPWPPARCSGACGAGSGRGCRRTCCRPASACTCSRWPAPTSCAPSRSTASLSVNDPLAVVDDVAQAFVRRRASRWRPAWSRRTSVRRCRRDGRRGVNVLRRQLDAPAGHQERARHPGRRQPQQTLIRF